MNSAQKFIFKGYDYDLPNGVVAFNYALVLEDSEFHFTEKLTFIPPKEVISAQTLKPVFESLLLVLGISYWKLYCPSILETPSLLLSKEQALFWNILYTKGLGEFYYKNKIDFRGLVSFPVSPDVVSGPVRIAPQNRSLVGIGGGKDSIVAAELLKQEQKALTGFMLNPHPAQNNIVKLLGIEALSMQREIDPQLFDLNTREGTYNGHIPISAIYAFISLFAAMIYDYRYIIVSNEKSANYGNVDYLGVDINHQWSKSEEFENLFQNYVSSIITPDVTYFSLLRPLFEIKIVELFKDYPQYFSSFTSCNTNFKIKSEDRPLWCGRCAKCAFAFGLLAAFLPKDEVVKIFNKNLYEQEELKDVYRELLGIKNIKPFDCVGTPEEVRAAFYKAYKKGEYMNSVIMKMFEKEALPNIGTDDEVDASLFKTSTIDNIPEEFRGIIAKI